MSELVLEVADLEAAERFYAGVLGLPVIERWPEREALWVMAGEGTRIGLWCPQVGVAGGRGGAHVHFAMHLAERDFDGAVARLRDCELEPQVEEHARRGGKGSRSAYVDDPDGNCVELWTRDVSRYLGRKREPVPTSHEARSPKHFDAIADRWDSEYDSPGLRGHWWRTRLDAVVGLVGDGPGTVLEVGVGTGRLLAALAARGWTVTGIDPAPRMVELARARIPAEIGTLSVARGEALPYPDESFDLVASIGVIEYTSIEATLRELARVLRPGGRAVVGLRNGRAAACAWQRAVAFPLVRSVKRIVPFGQALPELRRRPLSPRRARDLLADAGLAVERVELVGCSVLPDPLDRLVPKLAYRAAGWAERSSTLRRVFGTQRLLLARKEDWEPDPAWPVPILPSRS